MMVRTPRARINSALVSREPLNSNDGAPPRIWTFLSSLLVPGPVTSDALLITGEAIRAAPRSGLLP